MNRFWGNIIFLGLLYPFVATATTVETIEAELPFLKEGRSRGVRKAHSVPPGSRIKNQYYLDYELSDGRTKVKKKRKKKISRALSNINQFEEFDQFEK